MQHFDLTVQCWACNRLTHRTSSTSSSQEVTCINLEEGQWLAYADEAPHSITFLATYSGVFQVEVHKIRTELWWFVAESGWQWWKTQSRKSEPAVSIDLTSYTMYSRDTIRQWISEERHKSLNAYKPVFQLPKPHSLKHAGGKHSHTNALRIWLYVSVLINSLFSCLSFLGLLHRTGSFSWGGEHYKLVSSWVCNTMFLCTITVL